PGSLARLEKRFNSDLQSDAACGAYTRCGPGGAAINAANLRHRIFLPHVSALLRLGFFEVCGGLYLALHQQDAAPLSHRATLHHSFSRLEMYGVRTPRAPRGAPCDHDSHLVEKTCNARRSSTPQGALYLALRGASSFDRSTAPLPPVTRSLHTGR